MLTTLAGIRKEQLLFCKTRQNDWIRARGNMGPQEERAILSQVQHFFEQHGDSRFTHWYEEARERQGKILMRAGYKKRGESVTLKGKWIIPYDQVENVSDSFVVIGGP